MAKSPLKSNPLRNPGQSLDEALDKLISDNVLPYVLASGMAFVLMVIEWYRWYAQIPPKPVVYTILAAGLFTVTFVKLRRALKEAKQIRLGRDGEKAVGQYLEDLREKGAKVFHDIKGPDFNVDHVVIHSTGIYVIETKTYSKPDKGEARIQFDGEKLRIMGNAPDRNPVTQVRSLLNWLKGLLEESTGKIFVPRPVVVFPGWFVESTAEARRSDVWILNPKALPVFIGNSKEKLSPETVKLAAYHLSRFIRSSDD